MRKVRIKIDTIIVPIFLITQGLQFLDKTALNYANLFGYQEALNLKGQDFNYLSASKLLWYILMLAPGCIANGSQWCMLDTSSDNTPADGLLDDILHRRCWRFVY